MVQFKLLRASSSLLLLLLLSHFSRVQLCMTPQTAAHQAPPSLGFSRQEDWSGVPFPSPQASWITNNNQVLFRCKSLLLWTVHTGDTRSIHLPIADIIATSQSQFFVSIHLTLKKSLHHRIPLYPLVLSIHRPTSRDLVLPCSIHYGNKWIQAVQIHA